MMRSSRDYGGSNTRMAGRYSSKSVMPEIWTVLQPEFVAAGASVTHEGDKVVVEFFQQSVCLVCFLKNVLSIVAQNMS